MAIRIDGLQLRLVRLPLVAFFETSFSRVDDKTFILVSLEGGGVQGIGECVADVDPYYSAETNRHGVARDQGFPRAARARAGVRRIHATCFPSLARVRGHNMAKAAVEMAAWDLAARSAGRAARAAARRHPRLDRLGRLDWHPGSLDSSRARSRKELEAGYRRIKIKVKPGWDMDAVEIRFARSFGAMPLMVDANAAYTLADAAHSSRSIVST